MTREDLRLKLQVLLGEFQSEHNLTDDEIYTIAMTFSSLMYSEPQTRLIWYKEMKKVADFIANILAEQAENIMDALKMSDEEKEDFKKRVNEKSKDKDKVEN